MLVSGFPDLGLWSLVSSFFVVGGNVAQGVEWSSSGTAAHGSLPDLLCTCLAFVTPLVQSLFALVPDVHG